MAYKQSQQITLNGDQAFEELYLRLARWIDEIRRLDSGGLSAADTERIERCVALLGYMGQLVDLSHNFVIASAVLSLLRFTIGALVKVVAERKAGGLEGLPEIFVALSEIFSAIGAGRSEQAAFVG
jgi:hypothetical protein